MGFLAKLKRFFASPPSSAGTASSRGAPSSRGGTGDPDGLWFHFRCSRCGSPVRVRANRRNDLSRDEEGPGALLWRKDVMDNKCFQLMHAEIWLDASYDVVDSTVTGGQLITAEEYEAAQGK